MPSCPTCSKELDTESGVKIHHYNVHGESIAKEAAECVDCGSSFEYYPSDKEGMYCSDCVDNSWGNENLSGWSGRDHPNWEGGISNMQTSCDFCGEETTTSQWKIDNYTNTFCSADCRNRFLSEEHSGEGNPRYIDGKHRDREYGTGWKSAKRRTLSRDNYKCVVCGRGEDELGRKPSVHHKEPVREFDDPTDAHFLENLVCLCPKHHQEVESGNRKI